MLERSYRVLGGIGEHWKCLDDQHDLAGEREKCLEDVQTPRGWYTNSREQVLSPGCHRRRDDAREDDAIDEGRLPWPQGEDASDISRNQIIPRADEAREQVSHGPFDARLQSPPGARRTKAVGDLEPRDFSAQLTPVIRGSFVGNHDDEVDVGDVREPATGGAPEKDHADERLLDLRASPYERVQIGLDTWQTLQAMRRVRSWQDRHTYQ